MTIRYLDEDLGSQMHRATRFNGVGWYIIDDRGDIVSGPYATREAAETVRGQHFSAS